MDARCENGSIGQWGLAMTAPNWSAIAAQLDAGATRQRQTRREGAMRRFLRVPLASLAAQIAQEQWAALERAFAQRSCFLCGSRMACEHREVAVYLAELEAGARNA